MAEKRDNSGTIGKNERKEKETHPDIKGQCVIGGEEFWIDGWQKEGARGKFYSLSFKPKEARTGTVTRPSPKRDDTEIPF